jgi:hypothetical protein
MEQMTNYNSEIVNNNEEAIDDLFDACDKEKYQEFIREMFDSYITSWRYIDAGDKERNDAIFIYRRIEELLSKIQKPVPFIETANN